MFYLILSILVFHKTPAWFEIQWTYDEIMCLAFITFPSDLNKLLEMSCCAHKSSHPSVLNGSVQPLLQCAERDGARHGQRQLGQSFCKQDERWSSNAERRETGWLKNPLTRPFIIRTRAVLLCRPSYSMQRGENLTGLDFLTASTSLDINEFRKDSNTLK